MIVAGHPPAYPMSIDGLLYTNNAIFMMARKASTGQGQMIVNGAIVAADAGVLVPSGGGPIGLQLN